MLKLDITKNMARFFCTVCLDKNPSLDRDHSIPVFPQIETETPEKEDEQVELEEIVIVEEENSPLTRNKFSL